jgi:hypothetical protein
MAGLTGIGTTFNLPNYNGELYALTPTDTPLLSMAGGIGGGKQTTTEEFGWQTYDLRDPDIRTRAEGADAPNPEERVRANAKSVVQIYHEAVGTTYTKSATAAQVATTQGAPFNNYDGLGVGNPVINEHAWQVTQSLIQIARDANYAFWHAHKHVPTDNTTNRQMGGLLEAIVTNKSFAVAPVTAASATDTITSVAHGMNNGDQVVFTTLDVATGIRLDRAYFVVSKATDTFKVSATAGGAAIVLGTAAPVYVQVSGGASQKVSVDLVNAFVQGIFDNGGMTIGETRTLYVPSIQKTLLTKAFATAYGSNVNGAIGMTSGHTVGGVAVDHIVTDFGNLNLVVERALPKDCISAVSMEEIDPVFLEIPGKGVLFEEMLAKTGATDKTQIYGEIGLKWGAESHHGVLRGLAVK